MNNVKWTPAELAIWNIFLVAACAGLAGGAPAILQYLASTNVDVVLCIKLALAGGLSAFIASISTQFRKDGKTMQTALQAALDLLGQINTAVGTQVVQQAPTPLARAVEPQPIVLTPINQGTMPVQPPIIVQPSQSPFINPLATTATATVPTLPAWQTDLHFGDSQIIPAIPKQ